MELATHQWHVYSVLATIHKLGTQTQIPEQAGSIDLSHTHIHQQVFTVSMLSVAERENQALITCTCK